MSGSGGKSKEIVLGDEWGDIAVQANGVRVEIHSDGSVLPYTKGSADAHTSGPVQAHFTVSDKREPAANAESKPGDRMPDGSVFAGVSPDTSKPMYATPADAPLTCTFNQAQKYASSLDAHGHHDWRVPTKDELDVLYNNRAAIGGFNVSGSLPAGWYWSSSSRGGGGWSQRFSDRYPINGSKGCDSSLRCVR